MIRVPSTSLDELEDVFVAFENEVEGALTMVMGRVMRDGAVDRPAEKMSVDDLNIITPIWAKEVDRLLAEVKARYVGAANDQRARILDALNVTASALLASAPSSLDEFSGENASAITYLADARNRLVGVGDDLWSTARGELVTAMQQGESIPQMTKRVRDSTGLAAPRARTIARTEVVGASNAGSLAFMQQTGVASKKEWLATNDARTRPTHRAADGQKVAIDAKFNVGGALLDHPGDSYGPAAETASCRCTMLYEVDDDALGQAEVASEDQTGDTGLLPGVTPDTTAQAVTAPVEPHAEAVPAGVYDALMPKRGGWSTSSRTQLLQSLKSSWGGDGKILGDTLSGFQRNGSIARLRSQITAHLAGTESNERARVFIRALRGVDSSRVPDVLHRGLVIDGTPDEVLSRFFTPGHVFDHNISSYSTDKKLAQSFADVNSSTARAKGKDVTRVLIELEGTGTKAIPIENLAPSVVFAQEKEWVTAGRFEVVSSTTARRSLFKHVRGGWQASGEKADFLVIRIRQVETL